MARLLRDPGAAFASHVAERAPDTHVALLRPGESLELEPDLLVQVAETLEARHQLTRRIVTESAALQLLLIRRGMETVRRFDVSTDDTLVLRMDYLQVVARKREQ